MKKIIIGIIFLVVLLVSGLAGYLLAVDINDFKDLSPDEMFQRLISERDYAINQAVERGDFRCCVNPPCTMCYWEANQWNNFTAGTCACDDLIAQGKEPCPQCQRGVCKSCKITTDSAD